MSHLRFYLAIFIIIIIYLLGKQIQICSRGSNIAGTTRLKFSTNSRPKGNITKSTNIKYEYETKTQEIDTNNAVNVSLKYDTSMQRTAS